MEVYMSNKTLEVTAECAAVVEYYRSDENGPLEALTDDLTEAAFRIIAAYNAPNQDPKEALGLLSSIRLAREVLLTLKTPSMYAKNPLI
jgi:hypothetical protein